MNSNLTQEDIQDRYGHGLSEEKIMSLYPYEPGEVAKNEYSGEYMVTYDPLTAYALRQRYPVLIWGKKYKKDRRVFMFKKPRPKMLEF